MGFYGTTALGGDNDSGTVFKITPAGTLTTLHSFCSLPNCGDGLTPASALVQATDVGDFYGTTSAYFGNLSGTAFKITPEGTLTTLHNFDATDGQWPTGGLLQATNGNFYGTTFMGGAYKDGTVFSFSVR